MISVISIATRRPLNSHWMSLSRTDCKRRLSRRILRSLRHLLMQTQAAAGHLRQATAGIVVFSRLTPAIIQAHHLQIPPALTQVRTRCRRRSDDKCRSSLLSPRLYLFIFCKQVASQRCMMLPAHNRPNLRQPKAPQPPLSQASCPHQPQATSSQRQWSRQPPNPVRR